MLPSAALNKLIPGFYTLDGEAVITRLLELVTDLITAARTDTLTGIPNRRALFEDHGGYVTGSFLTVVDVNGLKLINDTHGHGAGDDLIRHVADSLPGNAYRLGGDEFLIISPSPVFSIDHASIGCVAVNPSLTLEQTIALADHKMYLAKRRLSTRRKRPAR